MKKTAIYSLLLTLGLLVMQSCGGDTYKGELLGSLNRPNWYHVMPFGMVYVPSGTLHVGPSDQDVNSSLIQRSKSISIAGFYMDNTEITNNEYRQFIEFVRDSIAHHLIGDEHLLETADGNEIINWKKQIRWNDEEVMDALEDMYYPESDRFWGKRLINPEVLKYEYSWIDYKEAAKNQYRLRNGMDVKARSELIKKNILLKDLNLLVDKKIFDKDIMVKVRSTGKLLKSKLNIENGKAKLNLLEDEYGISPGQACVFYSKDENGYKVLGGGWITK